MEEYNIKLNIRKFIPSKFGIDYSYFDKPLDSSPGNSETILKNFPIKTSLKEWEIEVIYSDQKSILGEARAPLKNFGPIDEYSRNTFIPIRFIFSKVKISRESKPKRWITPFYYQIHESILKRINKNISDLYDIVIEKVKQYEYLELKK